MPLARLFQYQHCLLRRNGVRAHWSSAGEVQISLREQLETLRARWNRVDDSDNQEQSPDRHDFELDRSGLSA